MTKKQFAVIVARIKEELANISCLQDELTSKGFLKQKQKIRKLPPVSPDSFTLRGIGSVLHDFYVAVEKVFEIIAREIDEKLPSGGDWHRELLKQMTVTVPQVRPAVVTKETAAQLDEFRAFRHVFRNVYGFNLSAERISDLLTKFPETTKKFEKELLIFTETLAEILPDGDD